jgi:hypothetical protein
MSSSRRDDELSIFRPIDTDVLIRETGAGGIFLRDKPRKLGAFDAFSTKLRHSTVSRDESESGTFRRFTIDTFIAREIRGKTPTKSRKPTSFRRNRRFLRARSNSGAAEQTALNKWIWENCRR